MMMVVIVIMSMTVCCRRRRRCEGRRLLRVHIGRAGTVLSMLERIVLGSLLWMLTAASITSSCSSSSSSPCCLAAYIQRAFCAFVWLAVCVSSCLLGSLEIHIQ